MKRLLAISLFIAMTLSAHAQLLWKISGNGLQKPSYLFGTHHMAPLSILDDIKGYQSAFNSTTRVIGEVVMSDAYTPASMQIMQKYMTISNDTTLKMLFTAEDYAVLEKSTKELLKMDVNQMPKVKPAFISNNLVVALFIKHHSDYNPQQQLDAYFQTKGKEADKKIAGLETVEFQFDMLFNKTPLQRQAEQLMCTLNNTEKSIDGLKRMTDSYTKQDLNGIQQVINEREGTVCDPLPSELERINDDRNATWMQKLPVMLKEESNFIAVGALHLIGDKGLVSLLKKAGYKVEPIK